jgi:hypothetical protein
VNAEKPRRATEEAAKQRSGGDFDWTSGVSASRVGIIRCESFKPVGAASGTCCVIINSISEAGLPMTRVAYLRARLRDVNGDATGARQIPEWEGG